MYRSRDVGLAALLRFGSVGFRVSSTASGSKRVRMMMRLLSLLRFGSILFDTSAFEFRVQILEMRYLRLSSLWRTKNKGLSRSNLHARMTYEYLLATSTVTVTLVMPYYWRVYW